MQVAQRIYHGFVCAVMALSPTFGQADGHPDHIAEAPWKWAAQPIDLFASRGVGDYAIIVDFNKDNKLTLVLSYPNVKDPVAPLYRPVVFSKSDQRFIMRESYGAGNDNVLLTQYVLDEQLGSDDIDAIGIEMLDTEARSALAKAVKDRYQGKGIQTLPFPTLDLPYEFELTTYDGETISSKQLAGKVVVIDCWATWCSPCMRKMPGLKALQDEIGEEQLTVIGVNFDATQEAAVRAINSNNLTWPQIIVSSDQETRSAWHDMATVKVLPRVFVLDRQGILRADITSSEIDEIVRRLVLAK